MANLFSLPIWTMSATFSEEITLVSPLLIPETVVANESGVTLAKNLIQRLEKGNIEQGDYLEILRHAPDFSLQQDMLTISLQTPRKHSLYPDLELEFHYFYTQTPNQYYLGFVPVLGVEGYAKTLNELVKVLQRTIELEFSRKKRLNNVQRLISTQWYKEISVEQHLIETRFHSLSELANLHELQTHQWLPKIAKSLTPLKQQHCFGREKELGQLLRALTGKYSRSVLLVGRAGVGKTALIKEAYRVGTSKGLGSATLWETTAARMLQKLTVESGWEESLGLVLEELSKCGDILYVSNLAQLFEVGAYVGNPISMAEFMREYIALASVRLITECTDEELATLDTRAPGYTNLFQILRIEPPPIAQQSNLISHRLRVSYPKQEIPIEAIEETLRLQHRYALYSGFPGKTVRFLESILNQEDIKDKNTPLNREAIVTRFCEESGMPRFLVDSRTTLKFDELLNFFQSRLFGQDAAIDIVVNLLASVKTRLTRPGKPIASLLFVGPTGVGKTELAKALAEFMFGDSERLIRFDMSEFAEEIAILRLTGDISGKQGLLTDKIRQQPFSVVLFDELEKAHFVFYDLLLQIMGEGRLTDARGQVADFCSSVIIMTSNIGAGASKQRSPGFHERNQGHDALHQHYLHAVQHFFRPELFNRLDQVIPFNSLNLKVLRPIVHRELNKIKAREGLRTRNVTLEVEEAVIDYLANMSSDSPYGARQLQRCLQEQIVNPLATTLNRYSFSTSMKILVQVDKNGLEFKTKIYTQKARADQTLTDTKWTLRELTFKATEARRLAQKINEGPSMNQLWSQWDILERRHRRSEENFWQNPMIANEYGVLHHLLEKAKMLLQQIETVEIDCSLAFIGMNTKIEGLIQALLDWKKEHETWQVYLLDTVQPETGLCMLNVYGAADYLHDIVNIFNQLVESHGWMITERAVWLRNNRKKYIYTDHHASPEHPYDKLIGRELQIMGPGVALYFANEEGVHIWIDRKEEQHLYAVKIAQCAMSKLKTPKEVHRKKFLEGMEIQRHYWKNGFFDFKTPITHTGANWHPVLEKQLNEDFNKRLRDILCGEEPEMDLSLDDDLFLENDVPF
jgi:ATP-dependent Clp protease ATP-binding subunit ClpA